MHAMYVVDYILVVNIELTDKWFLKSINSGIRVEESNSAIKTVD